MKTNSVHQYAFLKGGGEMGQLTQSYDWSMTSVGPLDEWPTSLQVQLSLMLRSRFPMLIFWGSELLTFYNDAFRPSLGKDGKHPSSLGQPGEQSWAESWPVIGPMITNIMAGGEAVWFEDQKLPIYREGQMGYAYWTYSFSPLIDDGGAINGILVTCSETTKAVESLQQLNQANLDLQHSLDQNTTLQQAQRKQDAQFRNVANSSPTGLWLSDQAGNLTYLNETLVNWTGMPNEDLLGTGWAKAIVEEDRQQAADAFARAVADRVHYDVLFRINKRDGQVVWCRAAGDPFYQENGTFAGYAGYCLDIQIQVENQQQIQQSEQRFQNLIREASVGIIVLKSEAMRVEIVNKAYSRLIDRQPEELLGHSLFSVIPEAEASFRPLIDGVRLCGEPLYLYDQPYLVQVEGGQKEGFLNLVYQPYREADGTITGVMVLCQDVTQQVLARQRVQEAEVILREAVELAQLGTWSIEVATQKLIFSDRLMEWFGYDPIGQSYDKVIPILKAGDQQRVERAVAWALNPASDGVYNEIYTVIHAQTGQKRILHARGKTVFDGSGRAVRLNGMAQDITLQRELQQVLEAQVHERTQELQVANQDLKRSNDNLQQFAYIASHDLQEPLRKIQSFSSLLAQQLEGQLTEVGQDYLQRIQNAGARMSVLIKDLLTYSRISTRQQAFGLVSLDAILTQVLTTLDWVIQEREAQIDMNELPVLQGDESQLGQLFQNLLSNAIKFTPAGKKPHISIRYHRRDRGELPPPVRPTSNASLFYQINVQDNGIGFDEKYLDRIFQVFQRLHGKQAFAGTGVGLAICERVVENHGGAITARSQPGLGATFCVYLPA